MFDAADPKAFRRASRGTYSAAFYELPEAPDDALKESYPMLVRTLSNVVLLRVPGQGRLVHDDGAGHVPRRRRPGGDLRAPRAARDLAPRHRQRVDPRPRARALGRRRGHRGHRRSGPAARRARPPALAVPGRGVPLGSRPPPRHAPVLGRRPLVREPLRAQGRDALLDERERRRQVEARDGRPRHPHGQGLRRRARRDRAERPAGHRAAARVGRRDRALDDLPGAPRRRRDPPRPRVDGGHPRRPT